MNAPTLETEDMYYLIRMTHQGFVLIVEEYKDYGDDGTVREDLVIKNSANIDGTIEDSGSDEECPDH